MDLDTRPICGTVRVELQMAAPPMPRPRVFGNGRVVSGNDKTRAFKCHKDSDALRVAIKDGVS